MSVVRQSRSPMAAARPGIDAVGLCVVFLCHDGAGEFVMARRGPSTRDEQGRWDLGGGMVEWGQTVGEAVEAEVHQEYGVDCESRTFLGYRDVIRDLDGGGRSHWLALDWAVRVRRDAVVNNEPDKLDDIGWYRLSQLPTPCHSGLSGFLSAHHSDLLALGIA